MSSLSIFKLSNMSLGLFKVRMSMGLLNIEKKMLDDLITKARASERKRAHLNVHQHLESPVQRLFIATEPETYIRPHRHPEPHKWEFFTVLKGHIDLFLFDEAGNITKRIPMNTQETQSVQIPPNMWHTYTCQESGTVALEVKEGAYVPTTAENFATWAPAENSPEAQAYLKKLNEF